MAQWTEDGFQDGQYPAGDQPLYRDSSSYAPQQQEYAFQQQGYDAAQPASARQQAYSDRSANAVRSAYTASGNPAYSGDSFYEYQEPSAYSAPQGYAAPDGSAYPDAQQQGYQQVSTQARAAYPAQRARSPYPVGAPAQQRFDGAQGWGQPAAPAAAARGARARSGRGSSGRSGKRSLAFTVVAALIGVVVGFLATFVVMSLLPKVPAPVSPTLAESELDTVVGTYRFDGATYQITARDAILGSASLASMQNDDGTFDAPSADMVMSYARNRILAQLVEDNGVTVTADEVAAYALKTVGTSDMAAAAQYVGMDEEQARQALTEAAAVGKLRESVVGAPAADAPVPPTLPADGNTEVGNAAYADYIIALLGPNWDAATGTWANTDNPYYAALADKVFAPGSANYDAAQAAYGVACEQYEAVAGASQSWTDYVNGYLDKAAISVATLRA